MAVDYAGQPADYDALRQIAAKPRGIRVIADACHAPGASYKSRKAGTLADISCFSFHPVKHLTTCEGGMCSHRRCRAWPPICAASAITASTATIARARPEGAHAYDMAELGYNYRLPDVQCALGLAQLAAPDRLGGGAPENRHAL